MGHTSGRWKRCYLGEGVHPRKMWGDFQGGSDGWEFFLLQLGYLERCLHLLSLWFCNSVLHLMNSKCR